MRYGDIVEDVYQYFLEKGLRTCRNNRIGYHMKQDHKTGRHYFRNYDNPNQIVIGSIKTKNASTFICIGVVNIDELQVTKEVFFCKFVEDLFDEKQIDYYIEQGFVKEKGKNCSNANEECQMPSDFLELLKEKHKELYQLFLHYNMHNLPSNLELSEKYVIKGTAIVSDNRVQQKIVEQNLSSKRQLTPLNDYEKDIVELINRKSEEEKELLEQVAREYTGKAYILK